MLLMTRRTCASDPLITKATTLIKTNVLLIQNITDFLNKREYQISSTVVAPENLQLAHVMQNT